ncbi:hypothetical protein F4804DRAFT_321667 [Jackrogersella minutella]|nr:hypothetical protein F4804DRAFT_321667 [Jackrogersella minutella]
MWATHNIRSFRFKLPGEYLLRAEGLALHAAHKWASAEFYISCTQIKVIPRSETPRYSDINHREELTPLVKIPGAYRGGEPGLLIPVFWSSSAFPTGQARQAKRF